MKQIEGHLSAKGYSFGIIVSRFNEFITGKLLDGARDALIRHGADDAALTVFWVPGAFELPVAARRVVQSGQFNAVICLGAVIRGDTPHFDYISAETTKGIAMVGLDAVIPVTFGVLTTDSTDQAIERAGTKSGNKGWDAACTAIELIDLYQKIDRRES